MMTRRRSRLKPYSYLACVLVSLLACGSTGCQWHGMYAAGGCGSCTGPLVDTGCDSCGETCDGSCGPTGQAFPGTCGTCAPGSCGGFSGLMLPLLSTHLACGSGCGDTYWGEWIYNPPECCGPCDDGCWAGSACDGTYCGYGPGYGHGLLAGPVAIIRGTYLGVSNVLQATCSTLRCGYDQAVFGHAYAAPCGCSDCVGTFETPACDSCGGGACNGDCVQASRPVTPSMAARPQGSGVRTVHVERPVVSNTRANANARSITTSSRMVNKRLRR